MKLRILTVATAGVLALSLAACQKKEEAAPAEAPAADAAAAPAADPAAAAPPADAAATVPLLFAHAAQPRLLEGLQAGADWAAAVAVNSGIALDPPWMVLAQITVGKVRNEVL